VPSELLSLWLPRAEEDLVDCLPLEIQPDRPIELFRITTVEASRPTSVSLISVSYHGTAIMPDGEDVELYDQRVMEVLASGCTFLNPPRFPRNTLLVAIAINWASTIGGLDPDCISHDIGSRSVANGGLQEKTTKSASVLFQYGIARFPKHDYSEFEFSHRQLPGRFPFSDHPLVVRLVHHAFFSHTKCSSYFFTSLFALWT
jgi:hypothetical protein